MVKFQTKPEWTEKWLDYVPPFTEITRADRGRRQAGILIIDVDRFKLVNDTHGHLAGDLVLHRIATTISEVVRPYDCVGRFGGMTTVSRP